MTDISIPLKNVSVEPSGSFKVDGSDVHNPLGEYGGLSGVWFSA